MKCQKARGLILTDYMDGELSDERSREIEGHLSACAACRKFEAAVRAKTAAPFTLIKKEEPPPYIWEGIRERVSSGNKAAAGIVSDTVESMRWALSPLLKIPRPIVAFAAAAMVIVGLLAVIRPFAQSYALDEYLSEQAAFIAGLSAEDLGGENIFDTDIKSGVESFLSAFAENPTC